MDASIILSFTDNVCHLLTYFVILWHLKSSNVILCQAMSSCYIPFTTSNIVYLQEWPLQHFQIFSSVTDSYSIKIENIICIQQYQKYIHYIFFIVMFLMNIFISAFKFKFNPLVNNKLYYIHTYIINYFFFSFEIIVLPL